MGDVSAELGGEERGSISGGGNSGKRRTLGTFAEGQGEISWLERACGGPSLERPAGPSHWPWGVGLGALCSDAFIVLVSSGSLFFGTSLWLLSSGEPERTCPSPSWKDLWFQRCLMIRTT